jgi:hypothetical protein
MAKTTKSAAKKPRGNPAKKKAVAKSRKASIPKPAPSKPLEGAVTETELAILEHARLEVHSSLSELRDALLAVIRWSGALDLSFAQRRSLPPSVLRGAWAAQWKGEYQQWLQSIGKALDAAGRPAVAAIMDPNSHPHPALCWTATVRDQLNRLLASLHPMKEGADGLGFIRSDATSLPTAFPWPLANLRRMIGQLEAVAPTVTPAAKSADGAKSAAPEREVEAVSQPEADVMPPALDESDCVVLHALKQLGQERLHSAERVAEWLRKHRPAMARSGRTVNTAIGNLVRLGYAERPNGARSGARLTIKGLRAKDTCG